MKTPSGSLHGRETLTRVHQRLELLTRITAMAGVGLLTCAITGSVMQTQGEWVHASSRSGGDKKTGSALFHASGCEFCHGADGRGTDRGPDLGTVGRRLTRQQINRQIHDGGGGMPAFGVALQPEQIGDLVAFLHEKKSAPAKPKHEPAAPPTLSGPAENTPGSGP